MLDDDAGGRTVEQLDAFQRGVGVGDVVVGEFFALQLARSRDGAGGCMGFNVKGAGLMRVFAIATDLRAGKLQRQLFAEGFAFAGVIQRSEIVADVAVVLRGMREGLFRQPEAGSVGERASVGLHFRNQRRIVCGVGDDGNMAVVFRGRTHHCRAANVDVFNRVVQRMRL